MVTVGNRDTRTSQPLFALTLIYSFSFKFKSVALAQIKTVQRQFSLR